MMENMSEGVVLLDDNGTVLSANKTALTLFAATGSKAGCDVIELTRDEDVLEAARAALAGEYAETGVALAGRGYHLHCCPVAGGGAIMLLLDVTEREQAERLRREFSANVSHELKTPLTTIAGYAEMLGGGMVREGDRAEVLGKMHDESQRMVALVDDIMMLSRLDEAGVAGAIPTEEVDLAPLVREVARTLATQAREAGVELHVGRSSAVVNANRSMMTELFTNLLGNAIKYNKPGGSVRVDFEGNKVTVADTGIGIPAAEQPYVFDRFYRVDKSRSKQTGGTGLGLAIVKHIAQVHKAHIELSSQEGLGTTITIEFGATLLYEDAQGFEHNE
jgi:two-component system phosphate regulon sensor histidine kinase PhoR